MSMRTFAHIDHGWVRSVFEAESRPNFHPSLTIIDVTDCVTKPEEGCLWDEDRNEPVDPARQLKGKAAFAEQERDYTESELAERGFMTKVVTGVDFQRVCAEADLREEWEIGMMTNGVSGYQDPSVRNVYALATPGNFRYHSLIVGLIWSAVAEYEDKFGKPIHRGLETPQLLKYGVGKFFKEHGDSWKGSLRKTTVLLYLNEGYVGGDIVFTAMGWRVKPRTGLMLLFPSVNTNPHVVEEISEGVKYAVVSWAG